MLEKADVSDVSKAVMEAVQASMGLKDQVEEVRKLANTKMGR